MRRLIPLVLVATLVGGGVALRPGAETGACAQGTNPVVPRIDCDSAGGGGQSVAQCNAQTRLLRSARVRGSGSRGLSIAFTRLVDRPLDVDVFQVSRGRTVIGYRRVARFDGRTSSFRASRIRGTDGLYVVRIRLVGSSGRRDADRIALVRRNGRFSGRPSFYRRTSCGLLTSFRLERPAFGGRRARDLGVSFRLARTGRATVEVLRGTRVVRRLAAKQFRGGVFHRLRVSPSGLPRGTYRVRLRAVVGGRRVTAVLASQRL